ncbi:MAG: nitrogen fixation protein NifU [Patescibacteria group bacterium]|nr:nitrogen fixation protein NifU [Patescibacteria group bacterium]
MEDLYQEQILDHANNPRNKKLIENHTCAGMGENPSCGDRAELYFLVEENKIKDVGFQGEGCAVSIASISMLTEKLIDMDLNDVKNIMPGDIYKMLGIKISPARVNCALLSYSALENTIKNCKI